MLLKMAIGFGFGRKDKNPVIGRLNGGGQNRAIIARFRPIVKSHELTEILLDIKDEFKSKTKKDNVQSLARYAEATDLREHIV